jgi:hypothetical protein
LSASQLIRWLLCGDATQQEQKTDRANSKSLNTLSSSPAQANKQRK